MFSGVYKTKKRGECKQRGNCYIALAGGGNQSFLTDGDLQARGNDLRRTLLMKHRFICNLFPSPGRFQYLSFLSPISFKINGLRQKCVRKSDGSKKNILKITGIGSFFLRNYYNCGASVVIYSDRVDGRKSIVIVVAMEPILSRNYPLMGLPSGLEVIPIKRRG